MPDKTNKEKFADNVAIFKEFFTCPSCGRAICGEKKRYFTCQSCGRALCEESKLADFDDNYCGNCGAEIASAKRMALAGTEKKRVLTYKDGRPGFEDKEI